MTSTAAQAYYLPPAQSTRAVGGLGAHAAAVSGAPVAAAPYTGRYSYDPSLYTNTGSPSETSFASLGPVSGTGGGASATIGKIISLLHVLQAQVGGNPLMGTSIPLSFLETNAESPSLAGNLAAPDEGQFSSFLDVETDHTDSIPTIVGTSLLRHQAVFAPAPPATSGPGCCCCVALTSCCSFFPPQNDMNIFSPFPFDAPSPIQPQNRNARFSFGAGADSSAVPWQYVTQYPGMSAPVAAIPIQAQTNTFPWGGYRQTQFSPFGNPVRPAFVGGTPQNQAMSVKKLLDTTSGLQGSSSQSQQRDRRQASVQFVNSVGPNNPGPNNAATAGTTEPVQFFVGSPEAIVAAIQPLRGGNQMDHGNAPQRDESPATSLNEKLSAAIARIQNVIQSDLGNVDLNSPNLDGDKKSEDTKELPIRSKIMQ